MRERLSGGMRKLERGRCREGGSQTIRQITDRQTANRLEAKQIDRHTDKDIKKEKDGDWDMV